MRHKNAKRMVGKMLRRSGDRRYAFRFRFLLKGERMSLGVVQTEGERKREATEKRTTLKERGVGEEKGGRGEKT